MNTDALPDWLRSASFRQIARLCRVATDNVPLWAVTEIDEAISYPLRVFVVYILEWVKQKYAWHSFEIEADEYDDLEAYTCARIDQHIGHLAEGDKPNMVLVYLTKAPPILSQKN